MLTIDDVKDLRGKFTWNFSQQFYITTPLGNFTWNDPRYEGDNTLRATKKTYHEWIDPNNEGDFGRDKGEHRIGDYCGEDFRYIPLDLGS